LVWICDNGKWEKTKKKHNTAVPPYVPAKSKALKNISWSSNDSTSGGIKVKRYGRGRLCPVGSFSTENFTKWKSKIFKKQNINHSLEFRFNKPWNTTVTKMAMVCRKAWHFRHNWHMFPYLWKQLKLSHFYPLPFISKLCRNWIYSEFLSQYQHLITFFIVWYMTVPYWHVIGAGHG